MLMSVHARKTREQRFYDGVTARETAMRIVPKTVQHRLTGRATDAPVQLAPHQEAIVGRFSQPARREVRRLVRTSARMADLAEVFPGALYAIASRRGPPAQRLQALSLVDQGAPLKAVARALDLPLWLKKLPPESFSGELPRLPTSETFSRRIAARLPAAEENCAFWLASMSFAAEAVHEDFAIWLAEQRLFSEPGDPRRLFGILAAYAWYSTAVLSRGHSLIVVPWRQEIAFDTAICAAKSWLNRVRLIMQLGPGVITDPWLTEGSANGLFIVPLVEARDILEEAHAMQNCADQYADRVARDKCRLFSIRRGGLRIATMEIGPHPRETGVLTIVQLKARHNMPAPIDVWQAAHAWLAGQTGLKRLPQMMPPDRTMDNAVWQQVLAPYRRHAGGAPWLPDRVTMASMAVLDVDMAELARRGGVTSWLFT
jgi:hypothetical protein